MLHNVSDVIRTAAANAIYAPSAAQMHDVTFTYLDGFEHETVCMEIVVALSGLGKGYIDPMVEVLFSHVRRHDEEIKKCCGKDTIRAASRD